VFNFASHVHVFNRFLTAATDKSRNKRKTNGRSKRFSAAAETFIIIFSFNF